MVKKRKRNEHAFCIRGTVSLAHNDCASSERAATYRRDDKDDRFPSSSEGKKSREEKSPVAALLSSDATTANRQPVYFQPRKSLLGRI